MISHPYDAVNYDPLPVSLEPLPTHSNDTNLNRPYQRYKPDHATQRNQSNKKTPPFPSTFDNLILSIPTIITKPRSHDLTLSWSYTSTIPSSSTTTTTTTSTSVTSWNIQFKKNNSSAKWHTISNKRMEFHWETNNQSIIYCHVSHLQPSQCYQFRILLLHGVETILISSPSLQIKMAVDDKVSSLLSKKWRRRRKQQRATPSTLMPSSTIATMPSKPTNKNIPFNHSHASTLALEGRLLADPSWNDGEEEEETEETKDNISEIPISAMTNRTLSKHNRRTSWKGGLVRRMSSGSGMNSESSEDDEDIESTEDEQEEQDEQEGEEDNHINTNDDGDNNTIKSLPTKRPSLRSATAPSSSSSHTRSKSSSIHNTKETSKYYWWFRYVFLKIKEIKRRIKKLFTFVLISHSLNKYFKTQLSFQY